MHRYLVSPQSVVSSMHSGCPSHFSIPLVFIYNGEIDPRIDASLGLFNEFEAERSVYITSSDLLLRAGCWLP